VIQEVNFEGLVGPTHNYAGLSLGNRASIGNAGNVSNPRRAALQGIDKMRTLHNLGLCQGVLPPHQRPDPTALRRLGFTAQATSESIHATSPGLLAMLMSASSMWTANAATVSPSSDTRDGRLHLTPANLSSTQHRSFESDQTESGLRQIFADETHFCVHPPLPDGAAFADEGAANHGRFATSHGDAGIHVFVYGREAHEPAISSRYPRRQTRLASELISRSHGHETDRVLFVRQSDRAIDAGAFHNDVVSVINQRVLFTHEFAFGDPASLYGTLADFDVQVVEVGEDQVPLDDAITSYLFNSQLVTLPDNTTALIAPVDVEHVPSTASYLETAITDPNNPIDAVHTLDLRESMRNGGGPACLRLRVVMTQTERDALAGRVIVDETLLAELERWTRAHYRDELGPSDLTDPALIAETLRALDELTQILELGSFYPFQQ